MAKNLEDNRLLAALPDAVRERLRPDLIPVTLEFGRTLYRVGETLRHVYFPLDAVVSRLYRAADGFTVSVGLIGCEGIVGLASFLGGYETTAETLVIGAGTALRLDRRALEREFERGDAFQETMLSFTHAFIAQTGQIAVCNRHHTLAQQLCFWLLLYFDRVASNELRLTQELLGELLGVRREGVTRAALELKRDGLLDYRRGRITILDPSGIRALACECYHIVHNAYETLPAAKQPGLGTRDSGLGTRDSGLGTRDSGLGTRQECTSP
ncbi:MAG: Crp/Fnr family transcriptional regulator [Gammaproteobacteria bacterium]